MQLNTIFQSCNATYLEYYEKNISPKLQEIDITLKAEIDQLNIAKISQLLYISENEVMRIMKENNIEDVNIITFFTVMSNGTSDICNLFRRELECKTPKNYSLDDIAYIYQLPYEKIQKACHEAGIHKINAENIKLLFSYIPLENYRYN